MFHDVQFSHTVHFHTRIALSPHVQTLITPHTHHLIAQPKVFLRHVPSLSAANTQHNRTETARCMQSALSIFW